MSRTRLLAGAAAVGLVAALLPGTMQPAQAAPSGGSTPAPAVYPDPGAGTAFLDHDADLAGTAEPDWYQANIPFVDLPDQDIEDTYYYRWKTYKEALKYTGPEDGWILSEFLGQVGYSAPNGGIDAAAGHHVYEGRWLRDRRYLDDYLDYWLTGAGSGPKPATDGLNKNTTDWAHQYSFWVADAVLARAAVDGRLDAAAARLPQLERQWEAWAPQFDKQLGLYWQTPVWDAMEFTASSYQSDDPYHGGDGFRPTLNAYQYGDARAIAALARRSGDTGTATLYDQRAAGLKAQQEKWLWDDEAGFYKHVMRDGNPDRRKIADREEIGYIPWYFHMAPAQNARAWAQLTDPQGFAAPYGPTTVERRSPWYMKDANLGCCRWSGPSWPFATSQTLTAMGNLLADYPDQPYVDADDFTAALHTYALTQRKNGMPYVAEAHHPDENRWIYDGFNHSEDYNHSTFNDIVLSSLIGIRAQQDDTVRLDPQVPANWDHFAAENVPYHGHNLTLLWDRDGTTYHQGVGMQVYLDGRKVHSQAALGDVTVPVRAARDTPVLPSLVDDAANVDSVGYPRASSSYTWSSDDPSNAIDGQDFHLDVPSTRWTTYRSPSTTDSLVVDFGVPTRVSDVRTVFYDDGGGVKVPTSYDVQYRDENGDWVNLPGQQRSPATPVAKAVNRIVFDVPVRTDALRLLTTSQPGSGVGVTAFQSWREVDPSISATITTTSSDGAVEMKPGTTVDVETQLKTSARISLASDQLLAPRGWSVQRLSPALPPTLRPGTRSATWRVTVPAGIDPGADVPLRYLVETAGKSPKTAGDIASTRWVFDPATFGSVAWDDDFSTDRLGEYRVSGAQNEPAPALRVADGALEASSTSRAWGLVSAPVRATDRFAVVVEPRSFAGTSANEDSMFLGSAGSPGDFAASWYNHTRKQGGVNVVIGGQGKPQAEGPGSRDVSWAPGDRFATVVVNGRLTSWQETADGWQRLNTAPVGDAVPPQTLADWSPTVGLRLDSGTISVDRMTVLQ